MCSVLCSIYGFKTRYIHVYSMLVSVHGVKKEVYLCVVRLFWFMD